MSNRQKPSCCGGARSALEANVSRPEAQQDYLSAAENVKFASEEICRSLADELVAIPGGIYEMGARKSRFPQDLDSPRRKVKLADFRIAKTAVTNAQYARFVKETGYRTVAEREGWSFVFHLLLPNSNKFPEHPPGLPWWRQVHGAAWFAPEGPGSSVDNRLDHPVVHICWYDALAYCRWSGLRLLREAEWERAARGGLINKKFPWGNNFTAGEQHLMNTFQGTFPTEDMAEDGWRGTAPVTSYEPNGYGLYNMTGNVWEWVQDFFGDRRPPGKLPEVNPTGPATGFARMQRGGSYLCHDSYCDRYHVHSRTQNDPDSSTGNAGFRVGADAA